VSKYTETTDDDFDDFEFASTADADLDVADQGFAERARAAMYGKSAWQQIEQRRESAWLRDQLTDWDDLDVGDGLAEAR
jgi:hypothetical protein